MRSRYLIVLNLEKNGYRFFATTKVSTICQRTVILLPYLRFARDVYLVTIGPALAGEERALQEQERLRDWYLARMRKRALSEATSIIALTPATLINADREQLTRLLASHESSRSEEEPPVDRSNHGLLLFVGGIGLLLIQLVVGAMLWQLHLQTLAIADFVVAVGAGVLVWLSLTSIKHRYELVRTTLVKQLSRFGATDAPTPSAPTPSAPAPASAPAVTPTSSASHTRQTDGAVANLPVEELVGRLCNYVLAAAEGENLIADYSSDVICTLDEQCLFVAVSPSSKYCWDRLHFELVGASLEQLLDRQSLPLVRDHLSAGKSSISEFTFFAKLVRAGQLIDTLWTVEWSRNDRLYFACVKDVTAEKELERVKSEVIAVLTHDLRSPITNVQWTLKLIQQGLFGDLNESGAQFLIECNETIEFLFDLIADMLDVHRLESKGLALNYSLVQCVDLIDECIRAVQVTAQTKSITVTRKGAACEGEMDKIRIKRAIINLLANAIKFSPKNSKVLLEVSLDGEYVIFSISDEGPGIAQELVGHLFDRFTNVGNPSARRDGSGLGLFASKSAVEAHGGTILVDSCTKGTTFVVKLPANKRPEVQGP